MFLRSRILLRAGPSQLRQISNVQSLLSPTHLCNTTAQLARMFSSTRISKEIRSDEEVESYVRNLKELYGDFLPEGLLTQQEFAVYQRYFGAPVRMLKEGEQPEDFLDPETIQKPVEAGTRTLESASGENIELFTDEEGNVSITQTEIQAYERLSRDITKAYSVYESLQVEENPEYGPEEEEDFEEDEYDGDVPDDSVTGMPGAYVRAHPLTRMGKFTTIPSTVEPPEALLFATGTMLADVPNKHIDEAAYKLYGNEQLLYSPIATSKKKNNSSQFPIHPSDPGMTNRQADVHFATVMPGLHAQILSALSELRRRLGRDWVLNDVQHILDVGTGGAGVVAWNSIVEAEEAANGPRSNPVQIDTQSSPTIASHGEGSPETVNLKSTSSPGEEFAPEEGANLKATVIAASPSLRCRASKMLENTIFLPRLPDPIPHAMAELHQLLQPRKVYDIVIATNSILPINEDYKRKQHVENLWSLVNPTGGVLLLIEKGTPSGFDAIAGARAQILKHYVASPGDDFKPFRMGDDIDQPRPKEVGQIIAPCTNHGECPMFIGDPGLKGRKDFCRFNQRYIRPYYMQRIIKATSLNHEDAQFSYVAFRRGKDTRRDNIAPIDPKLEDFDTSVVPTKSSYSEEQLRHYFLTLPRMILPAIKAEGHMILDVCTPEARIERWVVPRSYGKISYRDARKSKWGDLWALGAKTKTPRRLNLGKMRTNGPGKARKVKITRDELDLENYEDSMVRRAMSSERRKEGKAEWIAREKAAKARKNKQRVMKTWDTAEGEWRKERKIKNELEERSAMIDEHD